MGPDHEYGCMQCRVVSLKPNWDLWRWNLLLPFTPRLYPINWRHKRIIMLCKESLVDNLIPIFFTHRSLGSGSQFTHESLGSPNAKNINCDLQPIHGHAERVRGGGGGVFISYFYIEREGEGESESEFCARFKLLKTVMEHVASDGVPTIYFERSLVLYELTITYKGNSNILPTISLETAILLVS